MADFVVAVKIQPLWIIHIPTHISIRFGVSTIPFGFEISWRGCYLGAMWKKYIIGLMLTKKKIAVFWLTARDAEIYPCENDLHLQSDFDLQAVELDSTSLVLCFSHRLSIHSPNIYWAPTTARPSARCLWGGREGEYPGMHKSWFLAFGLVLSVRWTWKHAKPKPASMMDPKLIHFLLAWLLWLLHIPGCIARESVTELQLLFIYN